tara:strand:- start:1188 stop:1811 length:624 start_codon:yes stop_codon:yes gene_type:complete
MKTKRTVLIIFSLCILSCGKTKNTESETTELSEKSIDSIKVESNDNEILAIKIKEFINWYGKNQTKLSKIELVNNSRNEINDTTKFYSVNFENTEKYLAEFKKSGLFSEKYIESQRKYFKNCESDFKAEPENDGPPSGFDYDIVMKSQDFEIEELIRDLKVKNLIVTEKTAKLTADFGIYYKLNLTLSKENEVWKIDDIVNVGVAEN